ncbi:hypothetical protein [Sneathiella sp.]|uniref:hypothetical protein n=1 Tax=Sneathiella sp. TaxID=1964365 RepID=UPI0035638C55
MSWREAVRKYIPEDPGVPIVPNRPKARDNPPIGTIGTFGTGAEQENGVGQHDAHVSDWMELEERAAIMEYDGGMSRKEAEVAANNIIRLKERR